MNCTHTKIPCGIPTCLQITQSAVISVISYCWRQRVFCVYIFSNFKLNIVYIFFVIVRERQLDQPCPNSECINGRIIHRKCTG